MAASIASAWACSRWRAHVLGSLGRTHDRRNVERGSRRDPRRRHADVQPRPHLRRGGGVARRLDRRPSSPCSPSSPPHVSAYALTIEPGTPLAAQPDRHPDDDDQADKYELVDDAAGRRPAWRTTRSRTGPGPGTNAGTTSCTGASRTTAVSAARPTRTRTAGAGGTCARPIATSSSCAPATPPRRRARRSTTPTREFERLELMLRMRDGVPLDALDGEALDGLVERQRRSMGADPSRPPDGQRRQSPFALMPANSSGKTRATLAVR